MIEGYELSKYLDPVTVRIINFIHKSKCLYKYNEDNNKVLKYTYLDLCAYNGEKEEKDYINSLIVNYSGFTMIKESSNWSIEYGNYSQSIRRKCNWCKIKTEFCPIKAYVDLVNYAKHNKLNVDDLIENMLNEAPYKTVNNEFLEKNIATEILELCDSFPELSIIQMLIESKTVQIVGIEYNILKYKHIDMVVNGDSLIDNLYNYYMDRGNIIEESFDLNNVKDDNDNPYMLYSCSPYKIAAYILHLCNENKLSYKRVFKKVFEKCKNVSESKFDVFYKSYVYQIQKLECDEGTKKELIEIITYIRNYYIKSEYHLPCIQININLQIEDEKLLDKIITILYQFAEACGYIKGKLTTVDAGFLYNKFEKDSEVLNTIDKVYKDSGLVLIQDIEQIELSQNKVENLFYSIESSIRVYDSVMTIIASKSDLSRYINRFPLLSEKIQHYIKVNEYTLDEIKDKIISKLKYNYKISETFEKNIRAYIDDDYEKSIIKNNDYIDKLYQQIVYNNFNFLNITDELKDDEMKGIRKENSCTSKKKIDDLVGLEGIKREIQKFRNLLVFKKQIPGKIENTDMNMNMLFLGNPGTGKTTVAGIMTDILYELGYIKKNKFIEATAKDLVAEYIGQTAIKTSRIIESALDGVLFIDEAYSIVSTNRNASYGEECVATLVQAMEKYRNRLVVIFAGYTMEMKKFIESNPGIASRIGYTFEFNNYTTEELIQILENYAKDKGFSFDNSAKKRVIEIIEENKNLRNFGNARFMINLFERLIMVHAQKYDENNLMTITKDDVKRLQEGDFSLKKSTSEIRGELEQLVGLENVKKELDGMIDLVMLNNKLEQRIPLNLNMVFLGNPGTGKTTVARIFAEILYNLGYIKNNKLIEVTGKDLIGEYIGQTSLKTTKVLENALDGLLFIDEAYSIMNQIGRNSNFSQDAISTITKYMTDYEGRITIIFAGYKEEMKDFLEMNSGLISRVGETIEFEDYSEEELMQIFKKEIEKAEFMIEPDAEEKVMNTIKDNKKSKNFGNARFVINMFKKIMMEHAKRCREVEDQNIIKTITIEDIPKIEAKSEKRIGF